MKRETKKISQQFFSVGLLFSLAFSLSAFEFSSWVEKQKIMGDKRISLIDEPAPLPIPEPPKPDPSDQIPGKLPKPIVSASNPAPTPGNEINKVSNEIKTDDQVGPINEGNVVLVDLYGEGTQPELPPVDPELLDTKPYFSHCKQNSFAKRFKCSQKEINDLLAKNLRTPPTVREMGGRQVARTVFVVNEQGLITDVKVINRKTISEDAALEAERVIRMIPQMIPATKDGKPVPTFFSIDLVFDIK